MNEFIQLSPIQLLVLATLAFGIAIIGGLIGFTARNTVIRSKNHELKFLMRNREALRAELGNKMADIENMNESDQEYREAVREHFERSTTLMSELVEHYRQMYLHLAHGAERLADMKDVKSMVSVPPPESIMRPDSDEECDLTGNTPPGR